MSLASVAAQQTNAATNSSSVSQTGNNALNSLSANFGDFLKLLMTQLQNQDPSSPLEPISSPASWCSSPASSNRSTPTRA